jgi:hypothetical protein
MMVSMAGKKGSMQFSGKSRGMAILTAPLTSSIVRCDRPARIEPAAQIGMVGS